MDPWHIRVFYSSVYIFLESDSISIHFFILFIFTYLSYYRALSHSYSDFISGREGSFFRDVWKDVFFLDFFRRLALECLHVLLPCCKQR